LDSRIEAVLEQLESRSRSEQAQLAALRERGVQAVLAAASKFMLDVGRDTGQLLNTLVRVTGARRVVEIGGSVGYSTIWFAEAVRATGGKVISIEIEPAKQDEQRQNLEKAGLLDQVELVGQNVAEVLPGLQGPLDLVLIDHWKDLYIREFDAVLPKMAPRGLVVADNILVPKTTEKEMKAYVSHVRGIPGIRSFTLNVGSGLELTCRG
jgi:predicted O-methyltransferase YrrM